MNWSRFTSERDDTSYFDRREAQNLRNEETAYEQLIEQQLNCSHTRIIAKDHYNICYDCGKIFHPQSRS